MKRRQKDDTPKRGQNSQQIRFGSITINIYTDPKTGLHTLSATVGGKRFKINRGRTTNVRNEASKFASNIADGMPEQIESLSQKKLEYFLTLEKRMSGTPLDIAVDFFLAHQDDKLARQRVPELVVAFLAEIKPEVSMRYYGGLHADLNSFAKGFTGYISEITTKQVVDWLTARKVAPKRWNNIHGILGRLWHYAQLRHAILRKEKTILDWVPRKKSKPSAKEIYTPEQMKKLLLACDWETLPLFILGGFAGIRSAELTGQSTEYKGLEWEKHILWDKQVIIVPGHEVENDEGEREVLNQRIVPMLPNVQAWLRPYRNERGLIWKLRHSQHRTDAIAERSGVKLKHNALRHSFCTYRASTEKDLAKVALEAGNSVMMLQQHYVRVQLEEVGSAWFGIVPPKRWNGPPIVAPCSGNRKRGDS